MTEARTSTKEHGRLVRRRLEASTRIVPHISWPGLRRVCRLTRITHFRHKSVIEVQYAITSLSTDRADATSLLSLWRNHWGIENRVHWIRDTVWQEDRCRVKNPTGGHNLACFRNAAINLFRLAKTANITAAVRENAYQGKRLLSKLGILKL